jgi:hypothetical protein
MTESNTCELFGLYETGRRRTKSEKKKEKKKKVDKLISKSRNGQRRGYLHFYTVNKSYKVLFREQRVSMVWGVIIRERERYNAFGEKTGKSSYIKQKQTGWGER